MSIQSIKKLDNIADLLKNARKRTFLDCFLSLFIQCIENDSSLWTTIDILLDKNIIHKNKINYYFNSKDEKNRFSEYRKTIKNFDEYVACCWFYLKDSLGSGNKIFHKFFDPTDPNEKDLPQMSFYYECINPIILYIKLHLDHFVNAISILKRYKILCEWYDQEQVDQEEELSLTNGHLNKYLFEQGFTYSLTETNTKSGRIDNFAFSIGISKDQLKELPDVIVVEGKFFKKRRKIFNDVFEQVRKRLNDFNLLDGYCVIYNKTNKKIIIQDRSGEVAGMSYVDIDGKKIFFIIINLGWNSLKSTEKLEAVNITINN